MIIISNSLYNTHQGSTNKVSGLGGYVYFKYGSSILTLRVNPSQYEYSAPQRQTSFKTQGNIVVEDYGVDLKTITFSGSTGMGKDADGNTGEDRLEKIKRFIVGYQEDSNYGQIPTNTLEFYNMMDVGTPSYTVTIAQQGFQYSRDDQNPLIYNYAISMVVIKDAGDIVISQEAPADITNQISQQRQHEAASIASKAQKATTLNKKKKHKKPQKATASNKKK